MKRRAPGRGSAFRLFIILGIVTVIAIAAVLRMRMGFPFWLSYLIGVNAVTVCAYFYDKRASSREMWRVPESVLHWMAFAGGSPAALVSQKAFRHKTIKRSFRLWFWGIVAFQVVLAAACLYYWHQHSAA